MLGTFVKGEQTEDIQLLPLKSYYKFIRCLEMREKSDYMFKYLL